MKYAESCDPMNESIKGSIKLFQYEEMRTMFIDIRVGCIALLISNHGHRYISENGNYSDWSEWSPCDHTCGIGQQIKTRKCNNPPPRDGGKNCSSLGPAIESQACNITNCPSKTLIVNLCYSFSIQV